MTYTLEDDKLRVVRLLSKNERQLKNARLIILEHILPTTEEFVAHLINAGTEIYCLLAKPYSIDPDVYRKLHGIVPLEKKSYSDLETTDFLEKLLKAALQQSDKDNKLIIVIDVGGYFSKPLTQFSAADLKHIAGVIEDTTFGHNRYLKDIKNIHVPVLSVARSALKEIEARFVGRDAVAAMDHILRTQGVSLPGRNALVVGYGMIGKNVARTLKASDLKVFVYDQYDHKNLAAYIDGYHIHTKTELLKLADIIYCATGNPNGALSFAEVEDCKDNVILVSVGSKDTEFDIQSINRLAVSSRPIGSFLTKYKLQNAKNVYVAKDGTAINFVLPSIPVEVLDLVFSEILCCISLLLNGKNILKPCNQVYDIDEATLSQVSKSWLRFVNR